MSFELARVRLAGWTRTMIAVGGLAMFLSGAAGFWLRRSITEEQTLVAVETIPRPLLDNPIIEEPVVLFAWMMVGLAIVFWFAFGSQRSPRPPSG